MADVDTDPGLGSAVLRALIGAILIVAIPSLVFWGIGSVGDDDESVVADSGDEPSDAGSTDGGGSTDGEGDDGADGADGEDGGESTDGSDGTDDGDGTDGTDDGDGTDGTDDGDSTDAGNGGADGGDDGDGADPDPEPDPDPEFPPGEVTVQVLDGNRTDDGSAASTVTQQLRDAGYRIIAENPAIAYEVTTVLWTAGFEAQGRQVAAEIGAPDAREQPGNLSTEVMVHVVVGSDRS